MLGTLLAVGAVTATLGLDDGVVTAATNGAHDLKCTIAGGLAGAVAGVGVGAACWLLTKADPCVPTGVTIASNVGGYITDKCNGAQN